MSWYTADYNAGAGIFGQWSRVTTKLTHRIASEPSLWRNDAQRNVHQADAPLPFDRGTAGTFRAQGQKLSVVFWVEEFVYFRENRRVYEL